MGKIRTKILGIEELEEEQKKEASARREAKKDAKKDVKKDDKSEPKEDIITEKEMASDMSGDESVSDDSSEKSDKKTKKTKKSKVSSSKTKVKGKNYQASVKKVDQSKSYPLEEAIKTIKSVAYAKFDESLEVHLNVKESGMKGEVALPHGTGKKLNVVIADDALLSKIDDGVIDFDILIAEPSFMPKLVKYAKVLGPKGLMPNPKAGTVTDKPQDAVKKFSTGSVRYKGEAKFPLLHQAVGKLSFADKELVENTKAFISAVGTKNITDVFVSSTMSPSVKVQIESL